MNTGPNTTNSDPTNSGATSRRPRIPTRVQPLVQPGHATSQVDRNNIVIGDMEHPSSTDPFIVLVEDWFSTVGFDWHPHRGFETVTLVLDGALEHRDNTGGHGILRAGDVQWTTTGNGLLHSELALEGQPVHTLQLWLNLPAALKRVTPRYQDLRAADAPTISADGVTARVFAGTVQGRTGAAALYTPATLVDIELDADATFVHELPGEHRAFFYLVAGALTVGPNATPVTAGEVVWFEPDGDGITAVTMTATASSHLIAYSGEPIGEPIALGGPFVMNTEAEVLRAWVDLRAGLFGEPSVPA
jgi:redox-sensitive bicupin YhaK (pirin superfamily)